MNFDDQLDFNHRLVLGLKDGLIEGDKEIRQLKNKLFYYMWKNIEMKPKMNDLKTNYDNLIGSLQSEIKILKTELEREKHTNLNFKFQLDQLQALSDEKEKKIEELKNENIKAKMSQKEKYRTKNGTVKKRLKTSLRNCPNNLDSKMLQNGLNVIVNAGERDSNRSPLRLCPLTSNDEFLKCSSVIKVDNIEVQIQPLVSPALLTFSSVPSSLGKSPTNSLICDESETIESQSGLTVNFDGHNSSNEDLNNETDFKDEVLNNQLLLNCEASIKNSNFERKLAVNKTTVHLEDESSVPKKKCDETQEPKPMRIDSNCDFFLNEKLNSLSKVLPMNTNYGVENSTSKTETDTISYDDTNSKSKPTSISSIFDPFEDGTSVCAKSALVNAETTSKSCCNLLNFAASGNEDVKGAQCETKRKVNVSYPLVEKCDEKASRSTKNGVTIDCDQFSNTLEPEAISNLVAVKYEEAEEAASETCNAAKLSSAERLFIDGRSLENTIEDLLFSITEPLKPIEEIENLRKFYEAAADAGTDIDLEANKKRDSLELNVTNGKEFSVSSRQSSSRAIPSKDGSKSLPVNVFSLLDEVSKGYEKILEDQKLFEEFAQSLRLESCRDQTVIDDERRENVTSPSYVVVLETTDFSCTAKKHQLDIRDEIFNDWAVMDNLNEIDFKNVPCESEDCHALEYTSVPSPSSKDALRLEGTSERIHVEANDHAGSLLCWMNDGCDRDRDMEETQFEPELGKPETFVSEDESIEREREELETVVAEDAGSEDESEDSELVIAEDEGIGQESANSERIMTVDERVEQESENGELVIAVDEAVEEDSENREFVITENVETEQELEKTKLVEDKDCEVKSGDLEGSCNTDSSVSGHSGPATRYNLRRKATLNYASLNKGCAYRRKGSVNSGDFSPPRKVSKSIASSDNEERVSSILSERDLNNLDDKGPRQNEWCLPKFYVESRIETNQFHVLPEKTLFEQVWSTIKNVNIDEPSTLSVQESTLIPCEDTIIRTAFEFSSENPPKSVTNKEEIINLNGVKRYVEDYLRKKKCRSLKTEAIANFLASIRFSNQTTLCCALEAVLLNSSKYVIEKQVNISNDYVFMCLEIDRKVFKGFVHAMKVHLKEKMFAKVFRIDENSNGLNMISNIILQSSFYATIGKATGNVDDTINLLYESLLSLKNRAHPIAYGVLTHWPDVLKCHPRKALLIDIILFCYVHHKMIYNGDIYKITEVQELIGQIYDVKLGEKTAEEYAKEAMMNIHCEYWVDAIVLLCKRQMFSWTYTNVIMKYLVPILNVWRTDAVKEALLLKVTQALHKIMLSCPYDKEQSSIYNFDTIVRTLSDILSNKEMRSRILKETVYLAICELSSRRFSLCLETLSSWTPPDQKMSSNALFQLNEMMNKKMNYRRWQTFIGPQNPSRRLSFRKNRIPGDGESEKCKISKQKSRIIRVGVTRSSQIQAKQAKTEVKTVKKKNKNKNRKKKKKGSDV